tara:strand:+ start:62 stop:349 length:288 start_codon:yes stop_codon:yes gene_type:complete
MSSYYKAYKAIKSLLKPKPSPVINSVKPGTDLARKRKVQDNVVSDKDKVMKTLDAEGKLNVRTKVPLQETNKKVSKILDRNKASKEIFKKAKGND